MLSVAGLPGSVEGAPPAGNDEMSRPAPAILPHGSYGPPRPYEPACAISPPGLHPSREARGATAPVRQTTSGAGDQVGQGLAARPRRTVGRGRRGPVA